MPVKDSDRADFAGFAEDDLIGAEVDPSDWPDAVDWHRYTTRLLESYPVFPLECPGLPLFAKRGRP